MPVPSKNTGIHAVLTREKAPDAVLVQEVQPVEQVQLVQPDPAAVEAALTALLMQTADWLSKGEGREAVGGS